MLLEHSLSSPFMSSLHPAITLLSYPLLSLMFCILTYFQLVDKREAKLYPYFHFILTHFHYNHILSVCGNIWHRYLEIRVPASFCQYIVCCVSLQIPMSKWTCTMPKRESLKRRRMWRNAPPMQCSMNSLSLTFLVRV